MIGCKDCFKICLAGVGGAKEYFDIDEGELYGVTRAQSSEVARVNNVIDNESKGREEKRKKILW